MKHGIIRIKNLSWFRRIAVATVVTFSIISFLTFFTIDSWILYTRVTSLAGRDEVIKDALSRAGLEVPIKDVFCRVGVEAPMPYLRCGSPALRFNELRRQVIAAAGFDFLATCGDMKRHEKATSSKPGVAYHSRHKSGLAFDYNQEDSRLLLVREDIAGLTYWRTYLRCEKQDGTCGVRADLDTNNAGRVSAFVFDFTAAAEALGWKRIPAQEGWEKAQTKKEFWHYETDEGVAFVTSESIAETGGEVKEQTLPVAAPPPPAALADSRVTEKVESLPDPADLTPVTGSRGNNDAAKKFAASRHAPSPPAQQAGATPAPSETAYRQMSGSTPERPKSLTQAKLTQANLTQANLTQANSRSGEQKVVVMLEVEQGRVVQAHIPHKHPEMEAYEAAALRIARNRRYPPGRTGIETITLNINPRN